MRAPYKPRGLPSRDGRDDPQDLKTRVNGGPLAPMQEAWVEEEFSTSCLARVWSSHTSSSCPNISGITLYGTVQ